MLPRPLFVLYLLLVALAPGCVQEEEAIEPSSVAKGNEEREAAPSEEATRPAVDPDRWPTERRWEHHGPGGPRSLCFEVRGERFALSINVGREPTLVLGSYTMGPLEGGGGTIRLATGRINRKVLGRCREYWVHRDLEETNLLGLDVRPGGSLELRLERTADDRLRLCNGDRCSEWMEAAPTPTVLPESGDWSPPPSRGGRPQREPMELPPGLRQDAAEDDVSR